MPTATLLKLRAEVLRHMGHRSLAAQGALPTASADKAVPDESVDAALVDHAHIIAELAASTPGHPIRSSLMTDSASITYGGILEDHIGPYGRVLVSEDGNVGGLVPAYPRDRWSIDARNSSAGRGEADQTGIGGPYFFITDDNVVYFTQVGGVGIARVRIVKPATITPANEGVLDLLPRYVRFAIKAGALAELYAQAGHQVDAARYWTARWNECLGLISKRTQPPQE
jgi:hypothetical protein